LSEGLVIYITDIWSYFSSTTRYIIG